MSDYAVYFVTLIIGAAIFYVFNAIVEQNVITKILSEDYDMLTVLYQGMTVGSAIVTVVLTFLVLYAARFLMKRRRKEFGIYTLLGMGKAKMVGILILETFFIGIGSLLVGILLGLVLSQGMSVLVIRMFEAKMEDFCFYVSQVAIQKTVVNFFLIYVCAFLFDLLILHEPQPVNLMRESCEGRGMTKVKNPVVCLIIFIVSAGLLAFIYQQMLRGIESMADWEEITMTEILTPVWKGLVGILAGTVGVFGSISGVFLFLAEHRKKFFWRGINLFTIKEMSRRFQENVVAGSVICVLLFTTICISSTSFSMNRSMNEMLRELVPADVQLEIGSNASEIDSPDREQLDIHELLEQCGLDTGLLLEAAEICEYEVMDPATNLLWSEDCPGSFVKISEYNQLLKIYGKEPETLASDEYFVVTNHPDTAKWYNEKYFKGNAMVILGGKKYHAKYKTCQEGFLEMYEEYNGISFYVLPDDVSDSQIYCFAKWLVGNYNPEKMEEAEEAFRDPKLKQRLSEYCKTHELWFVEPETKQMIRNRSFSSTAFLVFLGMYLGIVFLITSAAVLSMKELSQSMEAKSGYRILRQLGVDEKVLLRSHGIQSFVFFVIPLCLAVIHSAFGIQVGVWLAREGGTKQVDMSLWVTAVVLILIYTMYYIISYRGSRRIIEEE